MKHKLTISTIITGESNRRQIDVSFPWSGQREYVAYGSVSEDGTEYHLEDAPTQKDFDAVAAVLDASTPEQISAAIEENTYYIAYQRESGKFEIVEDFTAKSDESANAYAEQHFANDDWYVLDSNKQNINA